jgi:hypothetical protein
VGRLRPETQQGWVLAALLCLTTPAGAAPRRAGHELPSLDQRGAEASATGQPGPIPDLDPCNIAHRYARYQAPFREGVDAGRRAPELSMFVHPLERRWTYADLVQARDELLAPRASFWRFERTSTLALVVRLQRWQRRLAFRVGASEREAGGQHNFEGLAELEDHADYGRTFAAANGSLRGDLTLVFGNVGSATTLEDVQEGRASFLDLNPFREIGAQFDLAILEDPFLGTGGILIFRLRAAYLGLFDQVQGGDTAGVAGESQVGCGLGVKW